MRVRIAVSGVLAAGIAALASPPARADVVVTISKAQQQMSVAVDGSEAHRWAVSTGRGRYATPSGSYRPVRFERSWHSRKYDWAPMPYSIFFHKGYAIHGTTEVKHLGRAVSHGCVRLHPTNAATLFSLARAQSARNVRIVVTDRRLDSPAPAPQAQPLDRGFEAFGKADISDVKDLGDVRPVRTGRVAAPQQERVSASLQPGTHVYTMKVASQAELREVYRKYGIRW